MIKITSKSNENIKNLIRLNDKKYIADYALVESEKVVTTLIEKDLVVELYLEEKFLAQFLKYNIKTYVITREISKAISNVVTPSGVFAIVKIPKYNTFNTNFLVLENMQDPSNLGAILRTACACNFMDVYLINTVCPYKPQVTRSSMGYNFALNFVYFKDIEEFKTYANAHNLKFLCADMDGNNIFNYKINIKPIGIAIGNEGQGISSTMQSISYDTISIPMQNQVESLNAGVSASILMYTINNKSKED